MTSFQVSPQLLKGALVGIDPSTKVVVSTLVFQYNPETLTRSLAPQIAGGEDSSRTEALRLEDAPIETIKFDLELDATDRLEEAEAVAVSDGVYPELAALETLIYPKITQVTQRMLAANFGTKEIVPAEAPMTLLVWGIKRILPVRIQNFNITEEAYDVNLNPIRAKVTLDLRVLSYNDLPWGSFGSNLFFVHHTLKTEMAGKGSVASLANIERPLPGF
ncbi:hypothetical protein [Crocosphaera sp.]|uniref:CIS tube protein n=1 Tax=Crocosphaera sp. TaxID=2729996 RepID=UPI002635DB0D|nr:hypothetical protein [Crocosphaera sp.]MDJ0579911.1 hypothetical protein [Crocosphaera sp.]